MDCRLSNSGIALILVFMAGFTGCSGETPSASNSVPANSEQTASAMSAMEQAPAVQGAVARQASSGNPRITEKFAQLGVLTTKATTAESQFRFDEATVIWEEASKLIEELYGKNSWQANNCLLALNTARQEAGFSAQQIELLKSITESQKRIGELLVARDSVAALKIAEQTAPATIELFGENSWMAAKQLVQTSRLNQMNGQLPEAIAGFQQASEKILALAGPVHPELEFLHGFLADCFAASGDQRLAFANLKKSAQLSQAIYGVDSLQFATRANEMGVALSNQQDFSGAIRILRASEAIRIRELGESHPQVAHSRLNQSTAMMGQGDYQSALDLVNLAESAFRASRGDSSVTPLLFQTLRQKATALMLLNRPNEAEAPLRETLQLLDVVRVDDEEIVRAEFEYRLGVCLARQNQLDEATVLLQQSLTTFSRLSGADNSDTRRTRDMLVNVLKQNGQSARAAEIGGSVQPAGFSAPSNQFAPGIR